jgi:hypothetical protein
VRAAARLLFFAARSSNATGAALRAPGQDVRRCV